MIVDIRTYTAYPGKTNAYLALYEAEGFPTQVKHLGKPIGYFVSEIGELNQIVHMWGYESMADREKKRAAMYADPAWQAYLKKSAEAGYIMHQENKIVKSTSFSPL
jgi:hypothetical protein